MRANLPCNAEAIALACLKYLPSGTRIEAYEDPERGVISIFFQLDAPDGAETDLHATHCESWSDAELSLRGFLAGLWTSDALNRYFAV